MSLEFESYYNISEKQFRLVQLYNNLSERAVFLVPSGLDKEPLLQMISDRGSFFGRRPSIWTWGEFYRETSPLDNKKTRRVIDPPDHNLIIRYILGIYLKEMRDKGVSLPAGVTHRGFVSVLGDNIKDLLAEEVSPEHLSAALFAEEEDPSAPEAILHRLYSDYIEYLLANTIADNAQMPTLIKESLSGENVSVFVRNHVFIPVGFLSFTGAQIKLIRDLGDITECILILPETGLDNFHDAIKQSGCEYKERPIWTTNIVEMYANNSHLQFDAIARELALWAHGAGEFDKLGELGDYGDVGIMIAPRHLRNIENSLARYKIPFNTQVRGSVGETQLGGLPKMIWDAYKSGWNTNNTSFLLSNPLICGDDFDAAGSRRSFPEGYDAWAKFLNGRPREIFESMSILCSGLSDGGYPADILRLWRDFLSKLEIADHTAELIGEEISLDNVVKDLSSSLTELDKKIEILEDIKRDIGEAAKIPMQGGEAVSYLLDWSRTATLPISLPQSRSVTIYAGSPPVLTFHRYWIMTDVDYNTWPGKLRESPLLRNEYKQKINSDAENRCREHEGPALHIPDIHDEREQKEALFRRLIATGIKGTVITRSLTDSSDRPVGESQFMAALFDQKSKNRKWVRLEPVVAYPLSRSLPGNGDYCFPDAEVSIIEGKINRGDLPRKGVLAQEADADPIVSLSSLDDWIACPYRYWCGNILRLSMPLRDIFDTAKAGIFLHSLWKMAWEDYLGKRRSFIILIEAHWQEALKKEYPELADDPRLKRHQERLKKQVLSLAELQNDIEDAITGRIKVELEFTLPDYKVDGVIFRGRSDRIDFYKDGAVVLDYKSNKASQHLNELQLAAYSVILREKCALEPLGYGWLGHRDGLLKGYFADDLIRETYHAPRPGRPNEKNLGKFIAEAGTAMDMMSAAVRSGEFPALYDSDKCRICEFYPLCRKREDPYYGSDYDSAEQGGDMDD